MAIIRWFLSARTLAFVCLCVDLGCSGSGENGSGDTAGTGGITAFGGGGSGGMVGSGGSAASGTGGVSGTGGKTGSGGASGSNGMTAMTGGTGASGTGGMTAGSGGQSPDAGMSGAGAEYNPCPDDGEPCKILPLGDSITFGIQLSGAYRIELFRNAVEADQNITFVGRQKNGPMMVAGVAFPQNHEGYSGYTIGQIDNMVLTPALMSEPDIITLMIGTNDMYGQDPAGAPERLGDLLDHILSMNTHALLVVAKLTPLDCCMDTVDGYNEQVAELVEMRASAGKHVILVDMSETMLSGDNVHPNEAGYTHMGQVWYAALKELLPAKN